VNLPDVFYKKVLPTKVPDPKLIILNQNLSEYLGFKIKDSDMENLIGLLSGNNIPEGAEPIAMAYGGHQFGHWVPQLGDGRALLLGEIMSQEGTRYDLQLKGSGPTPFSRSGDGKAVLGPVLREYLLSESMHALGIPSTRALSAVSTGEMIMREMQYPGAILFRVSQSHVRIGTFEYFSSRDDFNNVRILADYVMNRHYPEALNSKNPYKKFLYLVAEAQAVMVSKWMLFGFIHGVMNTDNMQIVGETIDYGPCAFLDTYDPNKVFSSIDHRGRYSFGNQPVIAQWNIACLAQAILPLIDKEKNSAYQQAREIIDIFPSLYQNTLNAGFLQKIGLSYEMKEDVQLVKDLLNIMADGKADYTLTFRKLCEFSFDNSNQYSALRSLFDTPEIFDKWIERWQNRLLKEKTKLDDIKKKMTKINPAFIPRNHLVEEAINKALVGDFTAFRNLIAICTQPFKSQPDFGNHMRPPQPHEEVKQTFCGT
tara:strand:+ start:32057 stop:33502 length:1446 start_codon:yes stop_codon:yes gene_type:complete